LQARKFYQIIYKRTGHPLSGFDRFFCWRLEA